jgi:8-amino-7-oxononanoate synthase
VSELLQDLEQQISRVKRKNLYRSLVEPSGIDFSSNDYLGLSSSSEFVERITSRMGARPLTAPASRLLRGNTCHHQHLEKRLAEFKGAQAALLFTSGYQANLGVLSSIITKHDRVLTDELNHASLIDGVRLTRACKVIYAHADVDAIEQALRTPHQNGRTFIVTESLFSMDGDTAPLDVYAELSERYGAYLIVDDAHATGVFGRERGSGLVEVFGVSTTAFATISTFGKALGASGAVVTGSRTLIDFLINRCRPFIFTTAPPPLLLFVVEAALDILHARPHLRDRVMVLAGRLRDQLRDHGVQTTDVHGPIVPVLLGNPDRAITIAAAVQERGYDVRAIRPPTVPPGTSRLRVSVHANHTEEEIDGLAEAISHAVGQYPLPA